MMENLKNTYIFDFVYSSACPCSYELAEYARKSRNKATVSHSQDQLPEFQLNLTILFGLKIYKIYV